MIKGISKERVTLTTRELELVNMVIDGHSNSVIAARLEISEETVKRHLTNIFPKVKATSRTQVAVKVLRKQHAEEIAALKKQHEVIQAALRPQIMVQDIAVGPVEGCVQCRTISRLLRQYIGLDQHQPETPQAAPSAASRRRC